MAMSNRAKWMSSLVGDAFSLPEYEAQEPFTKVGRQMFENWMAGNGSPHLFIYYQKQYKINEQGEIEDNYRNSHNEFVVSDGEATKLRGKGIFFLRMTLPGKPVTASGTNDNEVLFGEISDHIVPILNTMVNQVYKPLIDRLEKEDWNLCESEAKKEFAQCFDKFAKELQEAMDSQKTKITLESFPDRFRTTAKNFVSGSRSTETPEMIQEFERLFEKWQTKIEAALAEAEAEQKKTDREAGPAAELEYWKQRMRKLTGIAEQLRTKNCRTVVDVLDYAGRPSSDQVGAQKDKIYLATSNWNSMENRITEALNEAKDNVKYLQTLEKFLEPLYNGNPASIRETLPALMNAIKMIHTIARYYNTNERMTGLFVKITNQMINNCKHTILNFRKDAGSGKESKGSKKSSFVDDSVLWDDTRYPPNELIEVLRSCQTLKDAYIKQYEITKQRLEEMPKAKKFDFNTNEIFGKFELFSRRIGKLIDLFSTIRQFKTLEKHNLENINPIVSQFNTYVTSFKNKINKPLLDFRDDTFDRDFVEFNVDVSTVENALTAYINSNFAVIVNIEDSLKLLRKFDAILERNNLKAGLKDKYNLLFAQYAKLLAKIDKQYVNDWKSPPIVRNLPIVAGSITWSRHLFHRASVPMEHFPRELLKRDNKPAKQVKEHNKVTINLFQFEYEWRIRWAQEVEKAKVGLLATLIIRHPNNNKLYVNFDAEIMTMIREAKCLSRLGIEIPESAKIVLLQEEKFKMYNNELQFVLGEYDRIVNKIRPNTKSLLVPHLEDLEYKLRPGMNTLTWTSMNIDGYLQHVHRGLAKLEQLIININDIMENRIENNLKTLSKTVLVNLPQESSTYTLDEFVDMQSNWIATESQRLKSKNYEVEQAVEDLIQTICSYTLDQNVEPISAEEIHKLSKYYSWSMYQALLHATKYSLNQMKERICGRRNAPKQILKPFFEVDVHLDGNKSILKPSLLDVQDAINRAASHVLKSTRKVQLWFQKETPEDKKEPFYNWIARDKEIVKVILLLTGSIQGTKTAVSKFLEEFSVYSWLWTRRPEDQLKIFVKSEPALEDYEEKLKEFDKFNGQIDLIEETHQIGALSLKTLGVKSALSRYINNWKAVYAKEIHKQAKTRLSNLADEIKQIRLKIDKPVKDIDSLGNVMNALEEIRKKESNINFQFRPITDMYNLIEVILADVIDRDELQQNKNLLQEWDGLVGNAISVRNNLHEDQATFKWQLIQNIDTLVKDVKVFREDFEKNGPMQADLSPGEALNKLKDFKEQFSVYNRKYHSYSNGEDLFALPNQEYPALVKTQGELEKLDKLYILYLKVTEAIAKWKETSWTEIEEEIENMKLGVEQFLSDCQRLPGDTKSYPAYKDLKKELDDMETLLPLVEMLADNSIKERHWQQLIELTGKDIPWDQEEIFSLKNLLDADLLSVQEDIEDISDNAIKQAKIDKTLREEIEAYWEIAELEIKTYQQIDVPCTIGGTVSLHQEKLEDHIIALVQMSAQRCVEPFRADVEAKLNTYTSVTETLDKWLKVMSYWMNLVAVFTSGDIAKQMPLESKTFRNVDTQWRKIMERAAEQKNFIACCQNDLLVNSLPKLQEDLEFCQKRLDSYLESKRQVFPRFYFCSQNDILKILSMGSDPHQVKDDFALLFDSIKRVTFDKNDRIMINSIHFDGGGATETVEFDEPVRAEGLIENWLCKVEYEMQRSVRSVCAGGANEVFSMPLLDFVAKYIAQVALLGIQIVWTQKVTECLERGKDRMQVFKEKEKEVKSMMNELVGACKTEIPTKQERTKVETLVTIHVYQKQLFEDVMRAANRGQIKDVSDFDWQKNARFYWRQDAKGEGQVIVAVTDVDFTYQYEYLGVKERLCVTILTEKCYITLAQALKMCLGGAPAGPAGTGKTETVKDLGCTLGIFVVVTNCSPEHRMLNMAKIFKGLCQSGLWGCFDEFNRIFLDTLSVVAAQVESIIHAQKHKMKTFIFPTDPDKPIRLNPACAYFITMNPGYAGRQELPENLKVLFRGVTMMVPDRQAIMRVKLASVGFDEFDGLDLKFNKLYKLCEEQLSKQRHYDFGLRNILSVLRASGEVLRNANKAAENGVARKPEALLLSGTLTDMNMSKFVMADKSLFTELIGDIFPDVAAQIKRNPHPEVELNVDERLTKKNLVKKDDFVLKIIQLYETSQVRHGFMVVGNAGCGKTTIYQTLTEALSECGEKIKYEIKKMNPKAITGTEMFGTVNSVGEWEEGIFSNIWKKVNSKNNKFNSWITCDGPVDAIWIENLNTVLDDNKVLTLANAERIPMSDTVKMTCEVDNLRNASPATVSRNGIVYVSDTDLYWEPLFNTWVNDRLDRGEQITSCHADEGKWVPHLVTKFFKHKSFDNSASTDAKQKSVFNFIRKGFKYVMDTPEVVRCTQMLNLLTSVLQEYQDANDQVEIDLFEKVWTYAFSWGIGGLFETDERIKFHREVLERVGAPLPAIAKKTQGDQETVFEYFVDPVTKSWKPWQVPAWDKPKKLVFSQLLIPTPDSTRAEYIIDHMASLRDLRSEIRKETGCQSTLLCGGSGTAKTSIILMNSFKFSPQKAFKRINFSFYTLPVNFQESIEAEVEKKGREYKPLGDKRLCIFMDDVSMPQINTWGDQITLEITRQLMDQKGFYFLDKEERGQFKAISGCYFLAAMNHPGGGRNDVPDRLKRQFFSINVPPPSTKAVESIYGQILGELLPSKKYSQDIVDMIPVIVEATIMMWETTYKKLLPTPTKFHYLFTIRELASVFGGIARVAGLHQYKVIQGASKLKEKMDPRLFLIGLWRHESLRTFQDKLATSEDRKTYQDILDKATKEKFRDSTGFEDEQLMTDLLFADYQRDDIYNEFDELEAEAPWVYEAVPSIESIKERSNERMMQFNEKYPAKKLDLVIFNDALFHLLKITRVLNAPSGNCMLVGVGGSGKQSLTKLGAFIAHKLIPFQLTVTKSYNLMNLLEDLKLQYLVAGPQGGKATFLMTDAEIKNETFLEALNSMLATGEIPGLHGKEDKDVIPVTIKPLYIKEAGSKGEEPSTATLWNFYINRVKDNLHTVLAFSPVGSKFRERAQKFPSLFSSCTIDWFLPWPEEALIDVSTKFLQRSEIECTPEVKNQLMVHMGKVHVIVNQTCADYLQQMRRYVYVTPKSYLSFINSYTDLYTTKFKAIDKEEYEINQGLNKLAEATTDIEKMSIDLAKEQKEVAEATENTNKLLKELDVENKKADIRAKEVDAVTEACLAQTAQIDLEKEEANRDLQAALPYLKQAEKAVDSIKSQDIAELKQNRNPNAINRMILDTVQLLFMRPLLPVSFKVVNVSKKDRNFIADSFDLTVSLYTGTEKGTLLQHLYYFSEHEKDIINPETIELLDPYIVGFVDEDLGTTLFDPAIAKATSGALFGLCTWARAMRDYHLASKIVQPKLKMLNEKTLDLERARKELAAAQSDLDAVNALKERLRVAFEEKQAAKQELETKAAKTKKRMEQANRLITSLDDNKGRWIQKRNVFKQTKKELIGNVAKACAFVSYCGPFNSEFRRKLADVNFQTDLAERGIPATEGLQLTDFLVDKATIGEWQLQGLPNDDLSIQNGIMVTRSTRYPLMIDPQSQAINWIKRREKEIVERDFIFTINNPNLKDRLRIPVEDGCPALIENIEEELDPMLDPLLEKQFIAKGRKKIIKLGDTEMDYVDTFRLYMTSRLGNPHFSPELAAKTTIIDFTVTQGGLEQQLLGRLISKEQRQLEEQQTQLQEDVTSNTKILADYEASLLFRLANSTGGLLDDSELIDVLAEIKAKSKEVSEKLAEAAEKSIEISEKRELFRPVAARGAVLYFVVVDLSIILWMYSTSLQQFLDLFDYGIDFSPKSQLVKDRVANIIQWMTRKTYRYINRSLFERDKVTFKLMVSLKILIKAEQLTVSDMNMMLKAGAAVDDKNKKFNWLDQKAWLNLVALSKHKFNQDHQPFFRDLPDKIARSEKDWKAWYFSNDPENQPIIDYEDKIAAEAIGHFIHLCLIRCLREDRAVLASQKFIRRVLGEEFMAPVTDQLSDILEESVSCKPILFLLAPGSDPTNNIDELARRKKVQIAKVSMGEGMETMANKHIAIFMRDGGWLILNNCHLAIPYMAEMEDIMNPKGKEIHDNFRIWLTTESVPDFPLGLLQLAIKVGYEPPKGIQAGLSRTYQTVVGADFLEKVEPYEKWRNIVFALCFMHSIVYERRKFGPLGFSVAYEFNQSDLEASLTYIENHMNYASLGISVISWKAIVYMVCEIQYGGRITDNLDREMFSTYGNLWLTPKVFDEPNYSFNTLSDFAYVVPDVQEMPKYMEYISSFPDKDSPVIFGLNPTADLTYRLNESRAMIDTLIDTAPKDSGGSGGKSKEEEVKDQILNNLSKQLPENFVEVEYKEKLSALPTPKGLDPKKNIPLNIFLRQEIEQFQLVLDIVRKTMTDLVLAIDGQIIMTQQIVETINNIYDIRVPKTWLLDATGSVEISWITPTLGSWLKGLIDRHYQLHNWLNKGRPPSFWLTGFYNQQGFLTAAQQEITRQNAESNWSLDSVKQWYEPQKEVIQGEDGRIEKAITAPAEGVLIHGLYLEGAAWSKGRLEESSGKELFQAFPIVLVTAISLNTDNAGPRHAVGKKADPLALAANYYDCVVYKYPKRSDKYFVTRMLLKPDSSTQGEKGKNAGAQDNVLPVGMTPKINWKLKGVALLCTKE